MQQAARVSQQCAFFLAEQGTPGAIVEAGPTDADLRAPGRPAHHRLRQRPVRLTRVTVGLARPSPLERCRDPTRRSRSTLGHRSGPRTGSSGVPLASGRSCSSSPARSALFLGYQAIPTLQRYGLSFFTEPTWQPEQDMHRHRPPCCVGTIEVALIALLVGVPARAADRAVHQRVRAAAAASALVSLVDLMAAVPSIVYGLWGVLPAPAARHLPVALAAASTSAGSRSSRSTPTRTPRCGRSRATPARRSSPASPSSMMVDPDGVRGDARRLRAGADRRAGGRAGARRDPLGR